jgi:hypothetical protein
MSESFPLPTEPEGVIPSLVERFNSRKVEVMMALYAPEAVFVANDGRTIRDRTGHGGSPQIRACRADIRRMTAPLQLRLYAPDRFDKNEMPLEPAMGCG